jgi:hypothetical protein
VLVLELSLSLPANAEDPSKSDIQPKQFQVYFTKLRVVAAVRLVCRADKVPSSGGILLTPDVGSAIDAVTCFRPMKTRAEVCTRSGLSRRRMAETRTPTKPRRPCAPENVPREAVSFAAPIPILPCQEGIKKDCRMSLPRTRTRTKYIPDGLYGIKFATGVLCQTDSASGTV